MRSTKVVLKDGTRISGVIWEWRPQEGWFSVTHDATGELTRIDLADCADAVTPNARVSIASPPEGETRDELARARNEGWAGS